MSYTVEKIGGTSMTAFDAVLENIYSGPSSSMVEYLWSRLIRA